MTTAWRLSAGLSLILALGVDPATALAGDDPTTAGAAARSAITPDPGTAPPALELGMAPEAQLPPLVLPPIRPDLLVLGSSWRLGVGTGRAPELGLMGAPMTVTTSSSATQAMLPMTISMAGDYRVDGRRYGYGAGLRLHVDTFARHQLTGRAVRLGLQLPEGRAYGRYYATSSVTAPWYAELATSINQASYTVLAAQGAPTFIDSLLPLRLEASVGRGRIIPIGQRLRLQKLARMLEQQGLLSGPMPDRVAYEVLCIWWALRHELGYARRLAYTLQALRRSGLLQGDVDQRTVYEFGRIFADSTLISREQGYDSRLTLRYGATWGNSPPPFGPARPLSTIVLQLSHRHIINLTSSKSWSYAGHLNYAPRHADRYDGRLDMVAAGAPASNFARLSLVTPITYTQILYDDAYNIQGLLALRARLSAGLHVPSTQRSLHSFNNAMAGLGAEVTLLRGRATGISLGYDADLGYAFGGLAWALGGYVRLQAGHEEAILIDRY